DDGVAGRRLDGPDVGDAIADDPHRPVARRRPGSVDERRIDDQGRARSARPAGAREEQEEGGEEGETRHSAASAAPGAPAREKPAIASPSALTSGCSRVESTSPLKRSAR